MKALVTGAAGFLGRHFAAELELRGWGVHEVDIARSPGCVMPGDDALWQFAHNTDRYDLVVHCAAAEPHRAAIDGKPMLLAANLQLDAAMFEWAVRTGTRVLYISSSAAYPIGFQAGHIPYRLHEDDADPDRAVTGDLLEALGPWGKLHPDANYGWSKVTGERLAAAAADHGVPVHVVRPFSGYGEDQSTVFPFPAIVDRARRGDLTVWGPPGQTRDWIHVSDLVAGALAVVDHDERRPVNLCTGRGTEMGDLAVLVARAAGLDPVGGVQYLEEMPTGVMYRVGDPTRMLEHYQPTVTLEEGIARALAR